MSPTAAKANLIGALTELRVRFDHVKDRWDDQTRRKFEQDVLLPLESQIRTAAGGLERLAEIMAAARRDCGDDA